MASEIQKSVHFLTCDIEEMKQWAKFKDSVQMLFEIFGKLYLTERFSVF